MPDWETAITTTRTTALLDRGEAARRCHISVSTFDKLRRDGLIPAPDVQMGKHLFWWVETIDELLARGGTRPYEPDDDSGGEAE